MRHGLTTSVLGGLASLTVLAGCPDRTISTVDPQQGRVEYTSFPVNLNRNIDILFVIDDSQSMADKQQNLKNNFPNFINVLNTIQGGLPDVHIGVVNSDVGTAATQDGGPGPNLGQCSGSGDSGKLFVGTAGAVINGTYISDIKQTDGTRAQNYTGSLPDVFGQMAVVGDDGCGFEQHMEAMKRALDGSNAENAGFLRNDAYLAVIFIADEDDCSMSHHALLTTDTSQLGPLQSFRCNRYGHVCDDGGATPDQMNVVGVKGDCQPAGTQYLESIDHYADFLTQVKGDANKVILAGIIGLNNDMDPDADPMPYAVELRVPPNSTNNQAIPAVAHSCKYPGATGMEEVADPPVRIQSLLNIFPNRSTSTTICQQDLSAGLSQIAQLLKTVIGDPCINGILEDADPTQAGTQYDCSVSDFANYGQPNQTESVIPQCDGGMTTKPCWYLNVNTANCTNGDHYELKIERDVSPPPNTQVISYCRTKVQ
jgi:hypothetical protein